MPVSAQPRSAPVARRKVAKNFRLTEQVLAMLDELGELHGLNRTEVLEDAVREKFRRDTKRIRPEIRPEPGEDRP